MRVRPSVRPRATTRERAVRRDARAQKRALVQKRKRVAGKKAPRDRSTGPSRRDDPPLGSPSAPRELRGEPRVPRDRFGQDAERADGGEGGGARPTERLARDRAGVRRAAARAPRERLDASLPAAKGSGGEAGAARSR